MDQQEVNVVLQRNDGEENEREVKFRQKFGQILMTNHDKFDLESKGNSWHKPTTS